MKTTILTAAVLMALGFMAHAEEPKDSDFGDAQKNSSGAEVKPAPKTEESEKPTPPPVLKKDAKADVEAQKGSTTQAPAEEKKSASSEERKKTDARKDTKVIKGFITKDGVEGELSIGEIAGETVLRFTPDSCKRTDGNCHRYVAFDKKTEEDMNDMKALRDAIGNLAEKSSDKDEDVKDEALTPSERMRLARTKAKEDAEMTEREVREEIARMLSTECNIDEEVVNRRGGRSESRTNSNLSSALGQTRFAGLQIPEKSGDSDTDDQFNSDAECATSVLKEFMDQYEADDVEDLKETLTALKDAEVRWRRELRTADVREKKSLEKKLEAVRKEIASVTSELDKAKKRATSYDKAISGIAKSIIIKPAVQDLATRKFLTAEDFFLHDLAATTPDSFKGVRRAASQSLLDIYKLQSQSYLAFSEMANRTQDPAEKLRLQQTALHYQQAAMNYNNMMNSNHFKAELGHSASQAGLNAKSVLEEIYLNTYNPGAQQISSYLSSLNTNGTVRQGTNSQMPQILMVQNADGTYSQVEVVGNGTIGGSHGRGGRVLPIGVLNNTNTSPQGNIQLARPLPNAPSGNLAPQAQPLIQNQQPIINNGGVNNGVMQPMNQNLGMRRPRG